MATHDSFKPFQPSMDTGGNDDLYDVIVLKRQPGHRLGAEEAMPSNAEEICTIHRGLPSWAAVAFARGFNEAERDEPAGVWAVIRKSRPPQNDKTR